MAALSILTGAGRLAAYAAGEFSYLVLERALPAGTAPTMASDIDGLIETLLIVAPSHQGGHSDSGAAIAKQLGVSFPISMDALVAKAVGEGRDPGKLWPWSRTVKTAARKRKALPSGHAANCDWQHEQITAECTCGAASGQP